MHPVNPPKFCITIVSFSPGVSQSSQEKSKTMVMQLFYFYFWGGGGERRGGRGGEGAVNKVHYGLRENEGV